jgi:hypothetical protein
MWSYVCLLLLQVFLLFPAALPAHMPEQMTCHQYAIKRFAGYVTLLHISELRKYIRFKWHIYAAVLYAPGVHFFCCSIAFRLL